ncbi:zinc-ribbon and DUF3426 domain-containing protein [Paraburkholderia bannensis]|uniref:zinc-ribbon and DUF3426 domain-containing protein n=1 Tax=Paraburkholderia bannensis TaxID=765414 RepID=UPI002AB27A8C|nr:DUF3426 domain-containing protein [Paraburkholderia bannensis]
MLLATRCPFCETVFRIQPAQLAARRGLVRCGHCQEAFDASGSLYEVPEDGDFALAVPVAADIAASLTTPHAAASAATHSAHVAHSTHVAQPVHPEPIVEPAREPEPDVVAGVMPEAASEVTSELAPEVVPDVAAPAHEAAPEIAAEAAPETSPEVTQAPAAEPQPDPAPARPAAPPNFAGAAWDPWAPLPDSHIDPRLQYNADHLPQASLAAAATRKAARATEMRVIHDDEPTFASEPAAPHATPETPAEPFPPATRWTRSEPELVPPEPIAPGSPHPGQTEPTLSSAETARTPNRAPIADPEPTLHRSTAIAASTPAFTALEPSDGDEPFAVTREAPARAKGHPGWRIFGWILMLALIVLLALQLVWWQRESVMVYWPASQPVYQQVCAQLGCHVSPPRDIDGLQVQPSDLRQVDDPHHLELKVPLRNRFQVALAYPAIELTLLDRQNNVVLRRVLWPQDYVPPGTRIDDGLAPHLTQTMIVRLDTGNVIASNFRIEIFYP